MRIGRSRESNSLLQGEPDDFVRGIEFVHRFAPPRGGELDREAAPSDETQRLGHEIADRRFRTMAVDLDQVEMRQAIDQARRGDLANTPKIIGVNLVDVAAGKL